jgi:hypothetical protein
MNAYRRHWYTVGLFIGVGVLVFVTIGWQTLGVLQRLLLLNFATLLLHQFEEYGWPGGEPAIMNKVLQPSATPERYPLNQNSAMVINVVVAYPFYMLPVFFPRVVWLGVAPVLFGILQFIVHGVVTNRKLRTFYNPGLLTVILGHVPFGAYYIYYIRAEGLATITDWVFGLVYLMAFTGLFMRKMTYTWLAKNDSPYAFADVEMRRFNVDAKLARISGK